MTLGGLRSPDLAAYLDAQVVQPRSAADAS